MLRFNTAFSRYKGEKYFVSVVDKSPPTQFRVRQIGKPIPDSIAQSNAQHYKTIEKQYMTIAGDVQGLNSFRYAQNLYGHQEYIEALSFQYYLESRSLISYENVCNKLIQFGGITLPPEDYILGVYDMTGELMRFAIGNMATTGRMPELQNQSVISGTCGSSDNDTAGMRDEPIRSLLSDLRELRKSLDNFDFAAGSPAFRAEVERKGEVMRASVDKVENALYGLVVRGNEFTVSNVNTIDRGSLVSEISTR